MRGCDHQSGSLFSYVDLEKRIRPDHPLRTIRRLVDDALASLDRTFADLYAAFGRPSIPPERLLRAMLLQAFYSIRSERLLMERLDYDLLFRWFVGLGIDDAGLGPVHLFQEPRPAARRRHRRPVSDRSSCTPTREAAPVE